MSRRHEFRAASAARKPIVIAFSDGREYEFPGDVEADAWLDFLDTWASMLEGETMPVRVVNPMFRTVIGDERFNELRKELTWTEMRDVATTLWKEYSGVADLERNNQEDPQPGKAGSPSSVS